MIRVGMAPEGAYRDIAEGLLARCLTMGGNTWPEVTAKLDAGHARLWLVQDDGKTIAALVTQLTTDDVYEVLLAGGTGARQWARLAADTISAWAREIGARKCRIWGRKGWLRLIPGVTECGTEDGFMILERANV